MEHKNAVSCGTIKLGSYEVDMLGKIGQGSYGVVYRGKDTLDGSTIAAKQCDIANEKTGADTMTEIKHFRSVQNHPHIVELYDCHNKEKTIWMIMEYCDAGDLEQYYKKQIPDMAEQLNIMYQSASAVSYMHCQVNTLIHRDLKPGNILMKLYKGHAIVKIADFGLSKIVESGGPMKSLTTTKAGTPGFMAPEFFLKATHGKSVDVFALGLVYLAMLTFKPGDTNLIPSSGSMIMPIGAQMAQLHQLNISMPDVVQNNPTDSQQVSSVKNIIRRMIKYESNERCQMRQVVASLEEIGGKSPCDVPTTIPKNRTSEETKQASPEESTSKTKDPTTKSTTQSSTPPEIISETTPANKNTSTSDPATHHGVPPSPPQSPSTSALDVSEESNPVTSIITPDEVSSSEIKKDDSKLGPNIVGGAETKSGPICVPDIHEDKTLYDVWRVELLKKPGKGLGLRIGGRRNEPGVFVTNIMEGSAADMESNLRQGDHILTVNYENIRTATPEHTTALLRSLTGKVVLTVGRPKQTDNETETSKSNRGSKDIETAVCTTKSRDSTVGYSIPKKMYLSDNEDTDDSSSDEAGKALTSKADIIGTEGDIKSSRNVITEVDHDDVNPRPDPPSSSVKVKERTGVIMNYHRKGEDDDGDEGRPVLKLTPGLLHDMDKRTPDKDKRQLRMELAVKATLREHPELATDSNIRTAIEATIKRDTGITVSIRDLVEPRPHSPSSGARAKSDESGVMKVVLDSLGDIAKVRTDEERHKLAMKLAVKATLKEHPELADDSDVRSFAKMMTGEDTVPSESAHIPSDKDPRHHDETEQLFSIQFEIGDQVRVSDDVGKLRELQKMSGGDFDLRMAKYIGKLGVVKEHAAHLMVKVLHDDGHKLDYHPSLLSKTGERPYKAEQIEEIDFKAMHAKNIRAQFKRFDVVKLSEEKEVVQLLQPGHGGWKSEMEYALGVKGMVNTVDGDGDVAVEFINSITCYVNPELLIHIDTSSQTLDPGDYVVISDDLPLAEQLQSSLWHWDENMKIRLGHSGIVQRVTESSVFVEQGGGGSVPWHPALVQLVAKEEELMQAIAKRGRAS